MLRDKAPRGLRQPSQDYLAYLNDVDAGGNGTVAASPVVEPSFPPPLTGYIVVVPNTLGITSLYADYPDVTAQPRIIVITAKTKGDAVYYGFNAEGVWMSNDQAVPLSGGKPFTIKMVDGKAVITAHDKLPRGLRNPSSSYLLAVPN